MSKKDELIEKLTTMAEKKLREALEERNSKPKSEDEVIELFTDFIIRSIETIKKGDAIDKLEQIRMSNYNAMELLVNLISTPTLVRYLQISQEVLDDIPNKITELYSQCGRGQQTNEAGEVVGRINYQPAQLLDKPLEGLFTYMTKKNIPIKEQIEHVAKIYAYCEYNDYHMLNEEVDGEFIDERNKLEQIRQVRTRLLS